MTIAVFLMKKLLNEKQQQYMMNMLVLHWALFILYFLFSWYLPLDFYLLVLIVYFVIAAVYGLIYF